eukprot:TRINITY_DN13354_c0_g1_i1.p1 TRINITY_DN13354_c0_g1~~TRINITY_DN13354_c0_g1_i1.p1  ORF type:complete len:242 (-),score=51.74 TRINITY_DN13354_c0_g1_i1:32-757(-)
MIAEGFVRSGATVYICSRRAEACLRAAQELNQFAANGSKCVGLDASIDLSKVEDAEKVPKILKEMGVTQVHVLVNNSGASWGEPLEKYSEKGWDRVFDLNVKGLFYLTRALLPLLEAAASHEDPARIINIGSIAGIKPQLPPVYAYDASKAAVHHLTLKLAADFAHKKITVNAVAPGFVPSDMSAGLTKYASEDDLRSTIPLERFGKLEDMAGIAIFLSSQAGSWITGTIIPVDGGVLSKL